MYFILDTSVWIEIERGSFSLGDLSTLVKGGQVFLSPVNIAEMELGLHLIKDKAIKARAEAMMTRLRVKPILRIDYFTGEIFGKISANLRHKGRGEDFRIMDIWLAAQCLQHQGVLITKNSKDFKDIPGLKIISLDKVR